MDKQQIQPSDKSDRRMLVVSGPPAVPRRLEPARVQAAQPSRNNAITPAFLLQVLGRWWRLALPAGLLAAGIAAPTTWFIYRPSYVADAWVRIEDLRPYVAFPNQEESKRFVQTQVEMIRSPVVVTQCLSQPEIAQLPELKSQQDPVKWVSKRVSIAAIADSELFRVKFSGPDPVNAAKIANGIVETYLKRHALEAREEAQKVIDVLEVEQSRRTRDMQRMQENVRTLAKQVTGRDIGVGPGTNVESAVSPLAALEQRLTAVEVERTVVAAEHQAAQGMLASEKNEKVAPGNNEKIKVRRKELEQALATDPEVVAMRGELAMMRRTLDEFERVSKKPDQIPAVQELKKRMATVQASLEKRKKEMQELSAADSAEEATIDRREDVGGMGQKLESLRLQENLLREKLEAGRAEREKLGDQATNLEFARDELHRAEDVFRRIADRITALQTEQSARARVSLWSTAVPPTAPTASPGMFVGGIGGFCFVLPFALALLWEIRVRRIWDVDQIKDETRLPVMGEILAMPTQHALPSLQDARSLDRDRATFEESVAQLRTNLMLSDDLSDLRVIAVASAVSGEGKTSVAVQLAVNLAETYSEPTLLVDCDLRDPDVHEALGVPLEPGLADVLTGQTTLDEAIRTSAHHRLQVLPAGVLAANPHSLFATSTFLSVLERLRSEYRYIVIDCPPVLAASEALVVAKAADGALLCTMRDVSRSSQIRQVRDRLMLAGVRTLGVVLSGVPAKSYIARYGAYKYAMRQSD